MSVEASSRSSPVSEGKGAWRRPPVVCVIRRIYTHVDFDRRDVGRSRDERAACVRLRARD